MQIKYNYVFYLENTSYIAACINDIKNRDNTIIRFSIYNSESRFLNLIYKIHHSQRINRFINIPLKKVWYRLCTSFCFRNDNPICFIFDARWLQYDYVVDYVKYLKSNYNKSKIICYYIDLVKNYNKLAQPDNVKIYADEVLAYDLQDSKKYSLIYRPTFYSKIDVQESNLIDSDIFFVGYAKDRLDTIISIYEKCSSMGLVCDFHIIGVEKEKQLYPEKIHYNQYLNYSDCLAHISHTKCVLEVMQTGAVGYTLRLWEAIAYDKVLMTNNKSILESDFYVPGKIIFTDNLTISESIAEASEISYPENIKYKISPDAFLSFIDDLLNR